MAANARTSTFPAIFGNPTQCINGELVPVGRVQMADGTEEHAPADKELLLRSQKTAALPRKIGPIGPLPIPFHERMGTFLSINISTVMIDCKALYRSAHTIPPGKAACAPEFHHLR